MKIESIWPGKQTMWIENRILYISIPFTWNLPEVKSEIQQQSLLWDSVIVGGPATILIPGFFNGMDFVKVGFSYPGVLQKINPQATRTTRGCVHRCSFCAVPIIEGKFQELKDWPDLPVVCDNNLLAASEKHFDRVVDRLIAHGWADFNQGLDARLLTDYHAERLAEIKKPMIRLSMDTNGIVETWETAYQKLRKAGIAKHNIRSYVLVGHKSSPADGWNRCKLVEAKGIKPLPQYFHDLYALKKNEVTEEQESHGWTDYERRKIMQWFYQHKKAVK